MLWCFFYIYICFWKRKQVCAWAGRGRETQRIRFWADCRKPTLGLKLMNHEIMTWAEIKSQRLNHYATQVPLFCSDPYYSLFFPSFYSLFVTSGAWSLAHYFSDFLLVQCEFSLSTAFSISTILFVMFYFIYYQVLFHWLPVPNWMLTLLAC